MENPLKNIFSKAEDNFSADVATILGAIGGKDNVESVDHCTSRLRFTVKDPSKVNLAACKVASALGVTNPSPESVQVVFGTKIEEVYNELTKLLS